MRLRQRDSPLEEEETFLDDEAIREDGQADSDLDSYNDDLFNENLGFDDFGGGIPPIKEKEDLLKELTSFQKFIKDKINGWLGLIWDQNKSEYRRDPNIRPVMNRKCAAWCIDYLKTYTRENNIITDISKDDYLDIHEDIIEVCWYDVGTRMEEFGIKSEGDLHRICVELEHAAILVLMGAGDGKYNKFLGTATSRHESVNLQGQQGMPQYPMMPMEPSKKKGGIFSGIGKFFKGG